MTMGCHSSCGVFLLSSLDTMLAPQKQEQGSAVTETAERWKNRWRARTGEEREEIDRWYWWGPSPSYSTAENNKHIIIQLPKHLLSKCSLERN